MSLSDLKIGESGIISSINGDEKLAKRLLALGCLEGTEVKLKALSPFKDPLIISFRGFDLAIRKNDAKNITLA
ncbi:MAG: FeoA family protein [Clostridium sp.]